MNWNHRVMKLDDDGTLGIVEVYSNGMFTAKPVRVIGDDLEELRWTLERMLESLDKPIWEPEA